MNDESFNSAQGGSKSEELDPFAQIYDDLGKLTKSNLLSERN